jgi:hypothetical protein
MTLSAAVLRRIGWLVVPALLGALLGGAWAALQPLTYVASADVVPRRVIAAAPSTGPLQAPIVGATAERRQALAQLVRSPDVERAVQADLGSSLPPQHQAAGQLLPLVRGRTALRSEVITVVVEAPSRDLATSVAAAWSRAYVRRMNVVYDAEEVALATETPLAEASRPSTTGWALRGLGAGALAGLVALVLLQPSLAGAAWRTASGQHSEAGPTPR